MSKGFDCIEMKRKGAAKVHRDLAGMTREEKLEYWVKVFEELVQRQKAAQRSRGWKLPKAA